MGVASGIPGSNRQANRVVPGERGNTSDCLGMADDSRRSSASGHQPPPPGALLAPFVPALTSSRGAIIVSHPEARPPNKSSRATPERKPEDTVLGPHKGVYCRNPRAPPRWNDALRDYPVGTRTTRGREPVQKDKPRALTLNSPQLHNIDHLPSPRPRLPSPSPTPTSLSWVVLPARWVLKLGNGLSGGKTASHQVRGTPMVCGLPTGRLGGSARTLADVHPRCREPGRNAGVGGTYPFPAAWGRRLDVLSDPARLVNCPHTSVRKPHRRVLVFWLGHTLCEMDRPAETASPLPGGSAR